MSITSAVDISIQAVSPVSIFAAGAAVATGEASCADTASGRTTSMQRNRTIITLIPVVFAIEHYPP
jgi:hypothetical protein